MVGCCCWSTDQEESEDDNPPVITIRTAIPPSLVSKSSAPPRSPVHAWTNPQLQLLQPAAPHDMAPPPFPRHGHALPATASEDGDLFLFGGTFQGEPRNDLYLLSTYRLSATLLQTEGDKPPALVGHASALVHNTLVVWGGKANATGVTDRAVYTLNLDRNFREWTRTMVRGPAPVGRRSHAVTTAGYNFFVFGGLAGQNCYLNDLWMLDLSSVSTLSWKLYDVSHRPCGRTGHICFAYGNEIIIFGGMDGDLHYNDTWAFNLHTESWTELECTGTIPSPRHSHSGALVEHSLYLFGGMAINGTTLDDLYTFDIPNREWFRCPPLNDGPAPAGRMGHAMASMGSKIYVVGGKTLSRMGEHSYINILETAALDHPQRTTTGITRYQPVPMIPKVYRNLFEILMGEAERLPDQTRNTLHAQAESMAGHDIVANLTHSAQFRLQLLELASSLRVSYTSIEEALEQDVQVIAHLLRRIVTSEPDKRAVMQLRNQDAQTFVDLLQTVLNQGVPSDGPIHRLLVNLSEASNTLPSSLFLHGVRLLETVSQFGGGFADIFRGAYGQEKVALKRLRIFQNDPKRHETQRRICREILLWQRLKHPCIVPLLGIDKETSAPHICMVSPWMKHGTVLRFMEAKGSGKVDQHIREVAAGLAYLHSQNIVHGDVRGNNILIDDEERACLTDFGLTVFDNPTDVRSTAGRGSPRWMAPELFSDTEKFQRTPATDVWAFGCVCVELYTGMPPFPDFGTDGAVILHVINGGRPARPPGMPDNLWAIAGRCWAVRPDRGGMDRVVEELDGFSFSGWLGDY